MNRLLYASGPTSNDLLSGLVARHAPVALNYQIVAQSAEDVQDIENAPAVSMAPYLLQSGQIRLLTMISVYGLRGESREQVRLLYMNATAIRVWKEMSTAPISFIRQNYGTRVKCSRPGTPTLCFHFSSYSFGLKINWIVRLQAHETRG